MEAMAYVDFEAVEEYCEACAPQNAIPVFDEEVDCPRGCAKCGALLPYRLTDIGIQYLRQMIAESPKPHSAFLEECKAYYSDVVRKRCARTLIG